MQGWMFLEESYWTRDRAASLLKSVPLGRMLVLDLASTTSPQYDRLDSYSGQPFVFCMLHNYGGTSGLYAKVDSVNEGPHAARRNHPDNMAGTGMTPEGIHTDYVAYDLMSEAAWRKSPIDDLASWAEDYSERRYGRKIPEAASAWRILMRSAYNCCSKIEVNSTDFRFHGSKAVLTKLPSLDMKKETWYDESDLLQAWDLMVVAADKRMGNETVVAGGERAAFVNDLVDVSRQALANAVFPLYESSMEAFQARDLPSLRSRSRRLLLLVRDLDWLLSHGQGFLLGRWLSGARSAGEASSSWLREFNARNQVTLWGPHGEVLDYAAKPWSGLMRDYYLRRWMLFYKMLARCLARGERWRQKSFKRAFLRRIGIPFTLGEKKYPDMPAANPIAAVKAVHRRWRNPV